AAGVELACAVIEAGRVRAKPILLTALAAMIGALFILDDPIFSGLAISLLFGLFASTLLTLLVIPVLYYLYLQSGKTAHPNHQAQPADIPLDERPAGDI
ncbi:MAG: efflux RND transporter permease subunit, partial [Aeromonadaceae bacterium]